MSITTIQARWKKNLAFESLIGEHHITTDAPVESGGDNTGASPKKLMMTSLAGYTGVDIVSILKKMRVAIDELVIRVDAELTEEVPSIYKSMHLTYIFKGRAGMTLTNFSPRLRSSVAAASKALNVRISLENTSPACPPPSN